ncbi:hypothetical protein GUJ93_ZPchr0007g4660 [Zizania palustris]|uniref:Uncharacterized protein n=1 Tax=Zizania palustris TaxID=103762 RepID=A0A8J5W6D4_ZIZPA|nr:hypothetical protein GUJ93_ZPchr0007g4660 [Zizania palustris]
MPAAAAATTTTSATPPARLVAARKGRDFESPPIHTDPENLGFQLLQPPPVVPAAAGGMTRQRAAGERGLRRGAVDPHTDPDMSFPSRGSGWSPTWTWGSAMELWKYR